MASAEYEHNPNRVDELFNTHPDMRELYFAYEQEDVEVIDMMVEARNTQTEFEASKRLDPDDITEYVYELNSKYFDWLGEKVSIAGHIYGYRDSKRVVLVRKDQGQEKRLYFQGFEEEVQKNGTTTLVYRYSSTARPAGQADVQWYRSRPTTTHIEFPERSSDRRYVQLTTPLLDEVDCLVLSDRDQTFDERLAALKDAQLYANLKPHEYSLVYQLVEDHLNEILNMDDATALKARYSGEMYTEDSIDPLTVDASGVIFDPKFSFFYKDSYTPELCIRGTLYKTSGWVTENAKVTIENQDVIMPVESISGAMIYSREA